MSFASPNITKRKLTQQAPAAPKEKLTPRGCVLLRVYPPKWWVFHLFTFKTTNTGILNNRHTHVSIKQIYPMGSPYPCLLVQYRRHRSRVPNLLIHLAHRTKSKRTKWPLLRESCLQLPQRNYGKPSSRDACQAYVQALKKRSLAGPTGLKKDGASLDLVKNENPKPRHHKR